MDVRAPRWIGWTLLVCTGCLNSDKNNNNNNNRPSANLSTPNFQQISAEGKAAAAPASAAAPNPAFPTVPPSAPPATAASKNPIQQAVALITPTPTPQVVTPTAPPTPPPPTPKKSAETTPEGKRAFSTDSILTFAKMKEQEANSIKDNQERQMQMRDMARVDYQEVLRRDPRHREANLGLIRVYLKMRDYPKADETLQKALTFHPRDADLWTERGMMYKDQKNFDEAVRSFEQALSFQPENREMMKRLGYAQGLAGRLDDAFRTLQRAVGSAQAHYRIAQFHEMRDELPLARRHCLMAMQEQANFHAAQEMLVRLGGNGAQPTTADVRPIAGQ